MARGARGEIFDRYGLGLGSWASTGHWVLGLGPAEEAGSWVLGSGPKTRAPGSKLSIYDDGPNPKAVHPWAHPAGRMGLKPLPWVACGERIGAAVNGRNGRRRAMGGHP